LYLIYDVLMMQKSLPVGPVLSRGAVADAVIAAIQELNPAAIVESREAYLRVLSPGRCIVTRAAIEAHLGAQFHFPADLEAHMPAFAGRLTFTQDSASWSSSEGSSQ
jgi:hypothetical protein